MNRREVVLYLAAAVAWNCARRPPQTTGAAHRYKLQGTVVRIGPQSTLATIKHGPIRDAGGKLWMEAMTMEFPVTDPGDQAKLRVGQEIRATLFQRESDFAYWIGEIQLVPEPAK